MKYVYLLKAGSSNYKVGVALNVKKRLHGIQTSNADKVYIVATKLCINYKEVEERMHKKLRELGAAGGREWFILDPEDVIRVAIMINTEPEIDVYPNSSVNELLKRTSLIESRVNDILRWLKETDKNRSIIKEKINITSSAVNDELYDLALKIIQDGGKASTSYLQRKLGIGYGRAAKIIDELEQQEIITAAQGNKPRELIVKE